MTQSPHSTNLLVAFAHDFGHAIATELFRLPPSDRVRVLTAMRTAAKPRRQRTPRRPTLASVAKQANKAALDVGRYEVKPDGTIVVVAGEPEPAAPDNPWSLDEFRSKETKQ